MWWSKPCRAHSWMRRSGGTFSWRRGRTGSSGWRGAGWAESTCLGSLTAKKVQAKKPTAVTMSPAV